MVGRGKTSTIQADLKPGQYVALDVAGNGQPPLTPFTIAKAASPAKLPAPAGDYRRDRIRLPRPGQAA